MGSGAARALCTFGLVGWLSLAWACDAPAPGYDVELTLFGADVHEECVFLWEDRALRYAFTASAPVLFDIHYHPQDDPSYLHGPEQVASVASRTVIPPTVGEFCLNWTNLEQTRVRLQYSFSAEPR